MLIRIERTAVRFVKISFGRLDVQQEAFINVQFHMPAGTGAVRRYFTFFMCRTMALTVFTFPRIQQSSFEGYTNFLGNMTNLGSQGVVEVTGIPAGRYNFSVERPEGRVQMDGVAITKDGEEIDISKGEASSSVKFSVHIAGETKLPEQLSIGLRSGTRTSEFLSWIPKAKPNWSKSPLANTKF